MEFTKEQELAVNTRGADLLVSAAAGSGKTAVLVSRVIKMITGEDAVDVTKLLVVTFTEAAAAEMRARIRDALLGLIETNPGDNFLRSQESKLKGASITTIHSFCLKVLRKYCHLAGLDPFFKVCDSSDAELIKLDALNDLLEALYENDEELNRRVLGEDTNELFLLLVEMYGAAVTDDPLGGKVSSLMDFARGNPRPFEWLENAAGGGFEDTDWYAFLMEDARDLLEDALAAAKSNAALAEADILHEKYKAAIFEDLENIEGCLRSLGGGWDAVRAALGFGFTALSTSKVKGLSGQEEEEARELRGKIKAARDDSVKAPIDALRKIFMKPRDETLKDAELEKRVVKGLAGLAAELLRRFTDAKREANALDFADLEQETLQILLNEDGSLSDTARELSEHYEEIFIDEYQDSNNVQELLLASISGNRHGKRRNMFMVGDVLQSIYGFRLADSEIFNRKYKSFSRDSRAPECLVTLSKNFRSREAVLSSVNNFFAQAASMKLGGTEYTDEESLRFGADYYPPDTDLHKTELLLINDDGDGELDSEEEQISKNEAEAAVCAKRIKELLDSRFEVVEKDGAKRPVTPSDCAILLRSPKNKAKAYAEALKNVGIQAASDVTESFFDTPEILTALSFLRVTDNPDQDIPLAAVLYSRVYGLTATELLTVRQSSDGSLYHAVLFYHGNHENHGNDRINEVLGRFINDFARFRKIASREGVLAVVLAVLEDTGLLRLEGAMPDGPARQKNLLSLYDYAADFEANHLRGLFHFIRYIDKIIKSKKDADASPAKESAENSVRVMSIHKSKGLEFPVVLVSGLGGRFYLQDTYAKLLFHNHFGVGTNVLDIQSRVRSDTPKRLAISAKLRQESISEELRILYVAMTRAREKLILVGTGKRTPEEIADSVADCTARKLPYRLLKKNRSFMDFLLMSLARPSFSGDSVAVDRRQKTEDRKALPAAPCPLPSVPCPLTEEAVKSKLFYTYKGKEAGNIPKKLSVTEVKRLFYDMEIAESGRLAEGYESALPMPGFMREKSVPGAAGRGTVLHMLLERLDFNARTAADIREQLESMVVSRLLTEDEAKTVNLRKVERFLSSPLACRLRRADKIMREQNFTISLPAADINPYWAEGDIMVHGVMDLIFIENGKIVLLDYKTGGFTTEENERSRHALQMKIYAGALKEHFGRDVSEALIYFFDNNHILPFHLV